MDTIKSNWVTLPLKEKEEEWIIDVLVRNTYIAISRTIDNNTIGRTYLKFGPKVNYVNSIEFDVLSEAFFFNVSRLEEVNVLLKLLLVNTLTECGEPVIFQEHYFNGYEVAMLLYPHRANYIKEVFTRLVK